jgi:hypothetical protein
VWAFYFPMLQSQVGVHSIFLGGSTEANFVYRRPSLEDGVQPDYAVALLPLMGRNTPDTEVVDKAKAHFSLRRVFPGSGTVLDP